MKKRYCIKIEYKYIIEADDEFQAEKDIKDKYKKKSPDISDFKIRIEEKQSPNRY